MKKNIGFSLAEILIALIIVGILFAMTVLNMKAIIADQNAAKFKKAYANFEKCISELINNETIYGTAAGFKETGAIIIQEIGEVFGKKPENKFRDSFKYYINPIKDNIQCKLYTGSSSTGCFQTDEGVVWGIPDTDFSTLGVVKNAKDSDGDPITVVPITLYLDYKEGQDPKDDAVVIFLSYRGQIAIPDGTNWSNNPDNVQSKVMKYVSATTIKIDDSTVENNFVSENERVSEESSPANSPD